MNLSDMQARCKTRFRDPSNQIISDADWTDYLNTAYYDVISASPFWPQDEASTTLTVLANTRSIALPANVTRVLSVRNATDDIQMNLLSGTHTAIINYPAGDETGVPLDYRIFDNKLMVYPIPLVNTAFDIEYSAPPALLSGGSDIPDIPVQFHNALVEGALYRAYVDDGANEQASMHLNAFNGIIQSMANYILSPARGDSYSGISDTWFV